jgi:formate hydrogenlyase transcriptional activator
MSDPSAEAPRLLPHQYQALLDVTEAITRHGDLSELFHDLAGRLRPVVPFAYISVLLHDPATNMMRRHLMESEEPERYINGPLETPLDSPGGQVWHTQQPMFIPNFEREARFPFMTPIWRSFGLKSGYYLPLTTAQRRIGAIHFASTAERPYQPDDLELLQQVARQVALAVDNALNFQRAQSYQRQLADDRDRLKLLLEINNAVVSQLELRPLCQIIAATLRRVIQQDYTSLALYVPERHEWDLHALDFPSGKGFLQEQLRVPFDEAPASLAFRLRKPVVLTREELSNRTGKVVELLLAEGLHAWGCVPLISHGRVLGTLNTGRLRGEPFTPSEMELLEQVAAQMALAVDNALAFRQITELKNQLAEEKLYLEDELRTEGNFTEIVGSSRSVMKVLREVEIVAPTDSTVLIQGETGTGKELVARAIHQMSRRRTRTFVKINCAAIPTGLLESELFGHEKGAFTGAIAQKVGRFELAHQGTLFLDEVGDIPPELQPKLLRVLQEQEFERLGSNRTIRVDVRMVAATNRDLGVMVGENHFRRDLFYRLNVFPVTLPPLRERVEDIPLLVRHFVRQHARRLNKPIDSIGTDAMAALTRYPWPGNVRELENFIERAVLLSTGPELRVVIGDLKSGAEVPVNGAATLAEAERQHILAVLKQTNWVIGGSNGAASRLGMKRTTLQSKMQKLGIARPGR